MSFFYFFQKLIPPLHFCVIFIVFLGYKQYNNVYATTIVRHFNYFRKVVVKAIVITWQLLKSASMTFNKMKYIISVKKKNRKNIIVGEKVRRVTLTIVSMMIVKLLLSWKQHKGSTECCWCYCYGWYCCCWTLIWHLNNVDEIKFSFQQWRVRWQ